MNLQEEADRAENEGVGQKQAFTRKVRTSAPYVDASSFDPLLSLLPPVQNSRISHELDEAQPFDGDFAAVANQTTSRIIMRHIATFDPGQ